MRLKSVVGTSLRSQCRDRLGLREISAFMQILQAPSNVGPVYSESLDDVAGPHGDWSTSPFRTNGSTHDDTALQNHFH